MDRMRSKVWLLFSTENAPKGKTQCKLCRRVLSFKGCNTSSMKCHLESQHFVEWEEAKAKNQKEEEAYNTGSKLQNLDGENLVLCLFALANLPFSLAASPVFKLLLSKCPNMPILSPFQIKNRLRVKAEEYWQFLESELANATNLCVSSDGWSTDLCRYQLYCSFITYIDENWNKRTLFIGVQQTEGSATANDIGKIINRTLMRVGKSLGDCTSSVLDGGSNLKLLAKKVGIERIHCICHSLALVIMDVSRIKMKTWETLMEKAKKLAGGLAHSTIECEKLRAKAKSVGIIGSLPKNFCKTRWNGLTTLLQSYHNFESVISSTIYIDCIPDQNERHYLSTYLHFGQEVEELIMTFERDDGNASEILPRVSMMLKALRETNGSVKKFAKAIYDCFENRLIPLLDDNFLRKCMFFDYRFCFSSKILNGAGWQAIIDAIKTEGETINCDHKDEPNKKKFKSSVDLLNSCIFDESNDNSDSIEDEIELYEFKSKNTPKSLDSSPLLFWKCNERSLPRLSQLARRYLTALPSASHCERLFSRCSATFGNGKRNSLTSRTVDWVLTAQALFAEEISKSSPESILENDEIFDTDEEDLEPEPDSESDSSDVQYGVESDEDET